MTPEQHAISLYKRAQISKMFVLDDVKSICYMCVDSHLKEPGISPERKSHWEAVKKQIDRITYNNMPK